MPYLWYPPTLLALPLEIRHIIYSHLLIDKGRYSIPLIDIDLFKPIVNRYIFRVNRQIYYEAFEYYYSKNTFSLSLTTPYYSLREVAQKSDLLLRRLKIIKSLHLVIHTCAEQHLSKNMEHDFRTDTHYPKQQQQWRVFLDLISRSREGQSGRKIKQLIVEDWIDVFPFNMDLFPHSPVYASLEAPLKEIIDQIGFFRGLCKKKVL